VELGDSSHDREPEARTCRFGGEKWQEDLLSRGALDARATVADVHQDLASLADSPERDRIGLAVARGGRRFRRVAKQVRDRPPQENRRSGNVREIAGASDRKPRKRDLRFGDRLLRHRVQTDALRHEFLRTREEQKVAGHAGELFRLASNGPKVLRGSLGMAQSEIRESTDRGGGVAKLMSRSGGNFSEVGEVPGESDSGLQASHLREIGKERQDSQKASVGAAGGSDGHSDDAFSLARIPVNLLPRHGFELRQRRGDSPAELRGSGEESLVGFAFPFSLRLQNLPSRLIEFDDRAVAIDRKESGGKVARQGSSGDLQIVRPFLLCACKPGELPLFFR